MDMLKEQVKQTIREHHMLEPGSRVIAALSGGADPVCLLGLLKELEGEMELKLRAVHVHHGLRGQEADRDAEFAKAFCDTLSVPCHIIKADVKKFARDSGMSEEEAGRRLRYEILEQEASAWERDAQEGDSSPVRIATAHHSRDQAETILHNLLRGSGLKGLSGMPWVRGRIIRPLLAAGREEILAWLRGKGFAWVEDSSNASACYTRNRIRHTILPAAEREVNPRAVENLLRLGMLAGLADSYLEKKGKEWAEACGRRREDGSFFLADRAFAEQEKIIWLYGLLGILKETAGGAKDIGFVHVEQVLGLREKQAGRRVSLPRGMWAQREYEGLSLGRGTPRVEEKQELPAVEIDIFSYKKGEEIPKNMYTKWFDCDKIKDTPEVRTRREGDYLLLEDGSRKSIRRFMIDAKIPRDERDQVPLLADGPHVMWVIGHRISGYYKITEDTRRVMEVRVKGV